MTFDDNDMEISEEEEEEQVLKHKPVKKIKPIVVIEQYK